MSYSQQIANLRNNSWSTLTSLTAQSTELGRLESQRHSANAKLLELAGPKAQQAMLQLGGLHREWREGQALSDFMMFKMDRYLGSDDAQAASQDLLDGEALNKKINTNLIKNGDELPYWIKEKAAKLGGGYEVKMHKLYLNDVAERYPAEMRSMMLKSEEMVDFISPLTNQTISKPLNQASGLEEKMQAHNYLRNRYFATKGVTSNGYSAAFLSLSAENGGSGFLQKIRTAETSKDGMFDQYETNASIEASFADQIQTYSAFIKDPTSSNFRDWYDTIRMGVNAKNIPYNHETTHKKIRSELETLAKSNQFKLHEIKAIGKTKFEIAGQEIPASELWPKFFGENGKLMKGKMEGIRKASTNNSNEESLALGIELEELTERIDNNLSLPPEEQLTEDQMIERLETLQTKFPNARGTQEAINKINKAIKRNRKIPFDSTVIEDTIEDLINMSKRNRLITPLVEEGALHNQILTDSRIQNIIASEQRILDQPGVQEALNDMRGQFGGELVEEQGLSRYVITGTELKIAFNAKLGLFISKLKDGMTVNKARLELDKEWKERSADETDIFYEGTNSKYPNLIAQFGDTKDQPYSAFTPIAERITDATNSGELYSEHKSTNTEKNIVESQYNGDHLTAYSAKITPKFKVGAAKDSVDIIKPSPAIKLTFEEDIFKGDGDYISYITENETVPLGVIHRARELGISTREFINLRQTAWNKPKLDDKMSEMLGDGTDIQELPSYIRRELFSDNSDGYIQTAAEIAKYSLNPVAVHEQVTGDTKYSEALEACGVLKGGPSGASSTEKLKCNFGIALLSNLSPSFESDFKPGGEMEFVESFHQLPISNQMAFIEGNPGIGEKLYKLTGDKDILPVLNKLKGTRFDGSNRIKAKLNLPDGEPSISPKNVTKETTKTPIQIDPNHEIFDKIPENITTSNNDLARQIEVMLAGIAEGTLTLDDIPTYDLDTSTDEVISWYTLAEPFFELYGINTNTTENN